MAMSTYLKLLGFDSSGVDWDDGTCYWFFYDSPSLRNAVDKFNDKKSLVEPVEYNRIFSQTKREFYDSKPSTSNAV